MKLIKHKLLRLFKRMKRPKRDKYQEFQKITTDYLISAIAFLDQFFQKGKQIHQLKIKNSLKTMVKSLLSFKCLE